MKTLVLHGSLREEFGERFRMSVSGPAEALRLMAANFPGRFVASIQNRWFRVRCGPRDLVADDELLMATGADEIHIEPIMAGGIKGLFGLFFGFNLLGSVFGGGALGGAFGLGGGAAGAAAGFGAGGALGGIGSILVGLTIIGVIGLISTALQPDEPSERERPEEKPSFLFDGAVNVTEQGGPVPLVYGTVRTGSVIVAGGINSENVAI